MRRFKGHVITYTPYRNNNKMYYRLRFIIFCCKNKRNRTLNKSSPTYNVKIYFKKSIRLSRRNKSTNCKRNV